MRYCPHCNKPTIQTSGECPVCGLDLDESPEAVAAGGGGAKMPAAFAESKAPPSGLEEEAKVELDLGAQISTHAGPSVAEMAGLEEDEDEPFTGFTGFDPRDEPDPFEVQRLADFGNPPSSPFAAVPYSFRVKKRLAELEAEIKALERELKPAREERDEALARLGERARVAGYSSEAADKVVAALEAAESHTTEAEGASGVEAQKHQERLGQIQAEVNRFKELMAEPRARESALTAELAKREEHRRRFAAQLQKIDAAIAQAQNVMAQASRPQPEGSTADPAALRAAAAEQQAKLPALQAQQTETRGNIGKLDAHLAKVREELKGVRAELDRIDAERQSHLRAIEEEKNRFRQALGNVSAQTDLAKANVRARLTQLGGIVRMESPEDEWAKELYPNLDGHIKKTAEIWMKRDMFAEAAKAYDPKLVKQGQLVLYVGSGVLGLLVLIIVLSLTVG